MSGIGPAKDRLAFDEIFLLQLISIMRKTAWTDTRLSHPFTLDQESVLQFINSLPFSLTSSQNQAIKDILSDLKNTKPMNRLLEGDVGSGKTVVAAVAAYVTYLNGFQTLLMAPTQILAEQHYQTLSALFGHLGLKISLITGTRKVSSKLLSESHIVIGTHSLISNTRTFDRSGLVIIDEQHRFGVAQRALAGSLGKSPHILTMTATPIPRTVALTMYGDLDISILSEKPAGRLPVKTWVVPESKRRSAYQWIAGQISQNQGQAFIVCPFINDSETLTSVKAATAEFDRLKSVFPTLSLGLIHGKLKSKEKDRVINQFRKGEISILIATPVVEVGLDIPNAAVMVVEGAERFGLAQLHQLRGRVGRSSAQSYCLLFTSDGSISPRLKAMERYNSGLELAETDLKLRGPGEIFGTAQHGFPEFKVASYTDLALIEAARAEAEKVFPHLKTYPVLRALIKEDKIQLVQPN
jgi:ATP-dependent DNA helicase RecG